MRLLQSRSRHVGGNNEFGQAAVPRHSQPGNNVRSEPVVHASTLTSIPSVPLVSGGLTNPESTANRATSAAPPTPPSTAVAPPLMPLKQQRSFTSGPRGFTVWYSTESSESLPAPPLGLQVSAGMLYVHTNTITKVRHTWLCDTNGKWVNVTNTDNVKHPTISDRFLLVRSDGIPSWLTRAGYAAVQGRKGRAGT